MDTEQTDTDVFVGFAAETDAPEAKAPERPQDAQDSADATDVADEAETKPDAPETDEGGEGEGEGDGDGDEEKAKRRSKPAPERIAELTRARREAERRAEAAEAEVARMRGENVPGEATRQDWPATPDLVEPDPNAFEFGEADPGYLRALAKYEVKTELAAERQQQEAALEQRAQRERAAALDSGWQEQTAKAVERYEDFNEVIADYTKTQPCPPILAMAIQSSEHGADVAYHLAKNPTENAELAHLAQVNPLEAARRLGRLEARFEAREEAPKPRGKTVTDAPEPPTHRARGAAGRFETPDDTDDLDAFSAKFFAKR